MSKGYQRADSLAEILAKRAEKQRQSPAEKCQEIIKSPKYGSLEFPYQFKQTGMKLEVVKEEDAMDTPIKQRCGKCIIKMPCRNCQSFIVEDYDENGEHIGWKWSDSPRITKEMLDKIKDLPINKALTEAYKKD